ncbi:MAG: ABC transporter permease [Bacillota bacterium]|nr:ABC transporter permease [Bacillota bacterium]
MLKYLGRKIFLLVVMVMLISFIIFFALNNTGVDPVLFTMSMDTYDPDVAEALRESLGLNDPLIIRYFRWWGNMLQGDFGYSIARGFAIRSGLLAKWPASLELALSALVLSTILGIGIGMLSAFKQNSIIDYIGRGFAVLGNSMPAYFFALILIQIFSVRLGLLPSTGRIPVGATNFFDRLPHLILPVLALAIPMTGNLMRYTRNTMLDVANQEYIKTARSKGISEVEVYVKHIFRNSMRPVVTVLLFRLGILVGGSVAVETIFGWPGIGVVLTSSITASDYSVVMMSAFLTAVMMLSVSFLVDLSTALLDPRVRFEA